jgi:hypothetical protein
MMQKREARRGRVVDENGSPVKDAFVTVVRSELPEVARRTNEEGLFQVGLPPGRFWLQAVAPWGANAEVEVEGGEGGEIVIRVPSAPQK